MRWIARVLVVALLLAGCASEPEPDPGPCSEKYAVVTDTEAGVEKPVRLEVRVQDGRNDAPLADHLIYADKRPFQPGQGQYDSIEAANNCMAAAAKTDKDGVAVLFLAEGGTYPIVHPAVRAEKSWNPTIGSLWTVEVLPIITVERGMPQLVLPVYPGYGNFTWNGTIRGVDPNGNAPVEVNFPLFSEKTGREAELMRRLRPGGGDGVVVLDEVSLRWTNTLTTWGDLMVNVRHGNYFIDMEPRDKAQSPGDGVQQEVLCEEPNGFCFLDDPRPGKYVVAVYNTGGLVAPDGLPFSVTVQAWFTGPYD